MWDDPYQELKATFHAEFELFESGQNIRTIAADQRHAAFDAEIKRLTTAFDENEAEIEQQTERMLFEKIEVRG